MPGAGRDATASLAASGRRRATHSCSRYHDKEWGTPSRDPTTCSSCSRSRARRPASRGPRSCASAKGTGAPSTRSTSSGSRAYDDADAARLLARPGDRAEPCQGRGRRSATRAPGSPCVTRGVDPVEHLWSFIGGAPKVNAFERMARLPAETAESKAMSRDLEAARLPVRRADDLLRVHAGGRDGRRPHRSTASAARGWPSRAEGARQATAPSSARSIGRRARAEEPGGEVREEPRERLDDAEVGRGRDDDVRLPRGPPPVHSPSPPIGRPCGASRRSLLASPTAATWSRAMPR